MTVANNAADFSDRKNILHDGAKIGYIFIVKLLVADKLTI